MCDLSVGTLVDDTPAFIREALAEASNAHGYPTVIGTAEVRDAILAWGARRGMVDVGHGGVIPTIGSKEAVAWIPALLGVRPGDTVLVPEVSLPDLRHRCPAGRCHPRRRGPDEARRLARGHPRLPELAGQPRRACHEQGRAARRRRLGRAPTVPSLSPTSATRPCPGRSPTSARECPPCSIPGCVRRLCERTPRPVLAVQAVEVSRATAAPSSMAILRWSQVLESCVPVTRLTLAIRN